MSDGPFMMRENFNVETLANHLPLVSTSLAGGVVVRVVLRTRSFIGVP